MVKDKSKLDIWPTELDKYDKETQKAILKLNMTLAEIAGNYERSDKKVADISRLAQLNGCPKALIEKIIETELGKDWLPKKRVRKTSKVAPVQPDKVPAKAPEKKPKEKVSTYVMMVVQDRMDEVNGALMELTREIFQLEQRKKELEGIYEEYVDFMETHYTEENVEVSKNGIDN